MLDILKLDFPFNIVLYQRALIACLVIGFTNGYTSAFVVMHQSPLKLSALSHSLLPGIAAAALLFGLNLITGFFGAMIIAVIIGLATVLFSGFTRLEQGTVLAVLYTGAVALGVLILKYLSTAQELEHWLLGNILGGISNMDLWTSFGIGLIAVSIFSLFRRPILLTLFEPNVARTLGVPVQILNYAVFALLIMVLVTTLQAVGCTMAVGLIVTPAATVRQFTDKVNTLFIASGLLGAFGSSTGLILAYYLNFPAGASIVLVLTTCFLLSIAYKKWVKPKTSR